MRRIAIIPARGGSKRLPRKNVADLGGRPIITHTIACALSSQLFDRIIVSTDDESIGDIASSAGADIQWRDSRLATDHATVAEVCNDSLRSLSQLPERFCCIYATAAFISTDDIVGSEYLLSESPKADVVMGVSEYPIHPYKAMNVDDLGFLSPEWPTQNAQKSQKYPHFVASNGTIFWARTSSFLENPTFYPERLKGFRIPSERAVDIDTSEDLEWARKVMIIRSISIKQSTA